MADDVIREPHSVRRATGPLFVDTTLVTSPVEGIGAFGLLATIDPGEVHRFSDAELTALLLVAGQSSVLPGSLGKALRYEIVARILRRHGDLRPDEESA